MSKTESKKCILTFSDDFDGDSIDSAKWVYPYAPIHIGADVFAYCSENVVLHNSCIEIRAEKKSVTVDGKSYEYRTGELKTSGLFEQKYGRFEARIKYDDVSGIIPAFWLMPGKNVGFKEQNGTGAEIDVMEHIHSWRDTYTSNIHWGGYGEGHKASGAMFSSVKNPWDWHIYAVEWNESKCSFFVDGVKSGEYSGEGVPQGDEYMIISMALGDWGGEIIDSELPVGMYVDWVRAYKKAEAEL